MYGIFIGLFLMYVTWVLHKNRHDLRALYNTVKKQHGNYRGIIVTIEILLKMYWIQFVQYINRISTETSFQRNTVIISYVLNGHLYKIPIKYSKGPKKIVKITDEYHQDVTLEILPYLGPHQDWHGKNFTPVFWGKNKLHFHLHTEHVKSFEKDENIQV